MVGAPVRGETLAEAAYRVTLEWHVAAEDFDRTLPGEWMCGEWIPAPGEPFWHSLANCRRARRAARAMVRASAEVWAEAERRAQALGYAEKKAELQRLRRGA